MSSFPIRMLNGVGVGVVASAKRNIKPGFEFDRYFPKPSYNDPILITSGENEQTLDEFIPKIVKTYNSDTSKIADVLKRKTKHETLKAIFNFIYGYIQYKTDSPFEEQIRRPARTWADRKHGVDCDCYTTFISSILTNLAIPHYLRMSAYNRERGYQHIYVVVPKMGYTTASRSDYWTIDPVLDAFDTEKPFLYKKDRLMEPIKGLDKGLNGFPIRMLNGFKGQSDLVHNTIYYSPELKNWALKGLDGGFYLNGDSNLRVVQPLNGYAPNFIDLGVGVNGGFFKKVASTALSVAKPFASMIPGGALVTDLASGLLNKQKRTQSTIPTSGGQSPAPQTTSLTPITPVSNIANQATALQTGSVDSEAVKSITDKVKQSNSATVLSLQSLDKGLKSKIGDFSAVVGSQVATLTKQGASIAELTQKSKDISAKALEVVADTQSNSKEALEIVKAEQLKAEQFRGSQSKQNIIMLVMLALIAIGILVVALNKSRN